jgi:hypothetical protein
MAVQVTEEAEKAEDADEADEAGGMDMGWCGGGIARGDTHCVPDSVFFPCTKPSNFVQCPLCV